MIFPEPVGLTRQYSVKVQDTLDLRSVIYSFVTTRFLFYCFIIIFLIYLFIIIILPVTFIYISRTVVELILNDM